MENKQTKEAYIKFQLGHTCGVTVFKVLEQEGIERGCGVIFIGSNGWKIGSSNYPSLSLSNYIYIKGIEGYNDNNISMLKDQDKSIYNDVLQAFKELGQGKEIEPKVGAKVFVRDIENEEWEEVIYLHTLPNNHCYPFIVVDKEFEEFFLKNEPYGYAGYKYMKPITETTFKEISEDTFEVRFWVEG